MTRHGHRRLAWLGQGIDVGFLGHTVMEQLPLGYDAGRGEAQAGG